MPALAIPLDETDSTSNEVRQAVSDAPNKKKEPPRELDISDEKVQLPELAIRDLPRCPRCKHGLLRPGVVWFGEFLPSDVLAEIEDWMRASSKIDLIMVIGTSAKVYPAAGYVDSARAKGARVAVINMDPGDTPGRGMYSGDWFFQGDAGEIVPEILKSVIGEITDSVEKL